MKGKRQLGVVALVGILLGCAQPQSTPDRQLDEIFAWISGSFAGKAPAALAEDGELQDIFHKFAPIDAPQFGERVLYYQLSNEGPDGDALQAKIFVFDSDPERVVNRMRAYVIAKGQVPNNFEQFPDRWSAADPADLMSFPDECHFTWIKDDAGFTAKGASDCSYQSRAFKQVVRPQMSYRVTEGTLEWSETLRGEDGEIIVTTNGPLSAFRQ